MGSKGTLLLGSLLFFFSCMGQERKDVQLREVGGPCEGCEAIYEYGNTKMTSIDTLPEFEQSDQPLKVTGTIYQADGKTPASDVILYIHHTNAGGVYPTRGNEKDWARRHGYLRGWIQTGKDGSYSFYTTRPGSYPQGNSPAHIHAVVREPGTREYYLADYEFVGDPYIRPERDPRGGSGLVELEQEGGMLVARRDIILGMNIPDY